MICYLCGRRLARAAATVETAGNTGHAGPVCARKAGLLPPVVARPRLLEGLPRRRRVVESRQMELVA